MIDKKDKIVYCTPALYSVGGTERVVSVKAIFFANVFGYEVTTIVTTLSQICTYKKKKTPISFLYGLSKLPSSICVLVIWFIGKEKTAVNFVYLCFFFFFCTDLLDISISLWLTGTINIY